MAEQQSGKFSIIPARVYDDPRIEFGALRVLGLIGCYSDRGGWCYVSLGKLGERVNLTKQAIAKQIAILVQCGYLEKRAAFRENGSQTANRYRIIFDTNAAEFEPTQMFDTTDDDAPEVDGGSTSRSLPPLNYEVDPRTTYSNVSTKNDSIGDSGESLTPPQPKSKKGRTARKTQLPPDWQPSDEIKARISEEFPNVNKRAELEHFKDSAIQHARIYADWDLALLNWFRNGVKFGTLAHK